MPKIQLDKLFNEKPPLEENDINVFANRDNELEYCLKYIHDESSFSNIQAIHGASRVGKSHFLRRLLYELEKKQKSPFNFIFIDANSIGTARNILVRIYKNLLENIKIYYQKCDKYAPIDQKQIKTTYEYLNEMLPLVTGEVKELTLKKTYEIISSDQEKLQFLPYNIGLSSLKTMENKSGQESQFTRNKVFNDELIELIKYQSKNFVAFPNNIKKILLAVDDVDLLHKTSDGKREVDLLMQFLNNLAKSIYINIIITTRGEAFTKRNKELNNFIKMYSLSPENMFEIYEKHITHFYDGKKIFEDSALEFLAKSAEGRIGMFFTFLRKIFQIFHNESELLNINHIKEYVKKNVNEFKIQEQTANILKEINETIKNKKTQLEIKTDLCDSDLLYEVLFPLPDNKDLYSINRLYINILNETLEILQNN